MIIRAKAKKGQNILTSNGRFICSSVDPQSEAKRWVGKNLAKLKGKTKLILLGVGCGYHLAELVQLKPHLEILAIDKREEFLEFSKSEHLLQLSEVQFLNVRSIEDFKASRSIQKTIVSPYAVLSFRPAMVEESSFYEELECFALGRSLEGLCFQLEKRKQFSFLKSNLAGSEVARFGSEHKLYSIKDLADAIPNENYLREANMIRILRELLV